MADGDAASITPEQVPGDALIQHHDEEVEAPINQLILGHQNALMMEQLTGFIQQAMTQNRIDIVNIIDEKLASKTSGGIILEQRPSNEGEKHNGSSQSSKADKVSFKRFKDCGAKEFKGNVDPIQASEWIDCMENAFDLSSCLETDKVKYATSMFVGPASHWWKGVNTAMTEGTKKSLTWEKFKEKFHRQFSPTDLKRKYSREFMELKQGKMTVAEYLAAFQEKVRYATQYVSTEAEKVEQFVRGLRFEIQENLEGRDIADLELAAEFARRREEMLSKRDCDSEMMPPPKRAHTNFYSPSSPFNRSTASEKSFSKNPIHNQSQSDSSMRRCDHCGRRHYGQCKNPRRSYSNNSHQSNNRSIVTCYRCGELGHFASNCQKKNFTCHECGSTGHIRRDCPRLAPAGSVGSVARPVTTATLSGRDNVSRASARAFQITAEEAREAPDDNTG